MPYYAFILVGPGETREEMKGQHLPDDHAARVHASRIVRHLKAKGGYDNPALVIIAKDENENVLFELSFSSYSGPFASYLNTMSLLRERREPPRRRYRALPSSSGPSRPAGCGLDPRDQARRISDHGPAGRGRRAADYPERALTCPPVSVGHRWPLPRCRRAPA